ncbi:CocE/NonD family hydrolase [Desulfovermiculus halophilus]|uniref:CocE/NonD family hydrolase n=1 Tax=Desulfovermiculus halophilus TaxID=339722 RepID=UPI000482DD75|nr:CocE/NonD family hydrolase [Desulfovermiculus halophilus]
MKTRQSFPENVRVLEHVWIPLSDGIRVAAKIWLPACAERMPVPAVLEFIPYRKRDVEAVGDSITHGYFAGHGYACIRADLRGAGDSEGVLEDEYLAQEQQDCLEILNWIAAQPWCDGNIGMMGISWGGFNSLQLAALRPPELRAVITVCSTDDRYADDVHYMGGCLLGDNLSWASTMFSYNACPPDPSLVGGAWRDMWLSRLEGSGLWLKKWLEHQRRDEYWRHGSVCEDYSAISCPVLAVSGWADGYSNAVFRLLAGLSVPRMGLIGPWSHKYPHFGVPGPAIGFLQEALRWWDSWLKDKGPGGMDEPMLRVWMQDSVPPNTRYRHRPGRWVAETSWPSPRIELRTYHLHPGHLLLPEPAAEAGSVTIQSPLSVGLYAGKWCSYAAPPDLPHDQREEDGGALVFETEPLLDRLEILGAPVLALDVSSNRPVAMAAVRLSDVAPDDKATRVTYGLLNLCHRNGHSEPEPLQPGRIYSVRVPMNHIAQSFPPGHRLRISISTSYWPLAWPSPSPVRLRVHIGPSSLELPVRPEREEDAGLRVFPEPEGAPAPAVRQVQPKEHAWRVIRDLGRDEATLEVIKDEGSFCLEDIDWSVSARAREWYTYQGDDFDSVRGETLWERSFRRGEWSVRTTARTVLTSTSESFQIHAELDAFIRNERVFARNWRYEIPRDHV